MLTGLTTNFEQSWLVFKKAYTSTERIQRNQERFDEYF